MTSVFNDGQELIYLHYLQKIQENKKQKNNNKKIKGGVSWKKKRMRLLYLKIKM